LVVHSMYKEECSYIRPFIVIGPVLIGGSFMTLLFSVEICIRLYHNTKRVKDPDMDNVINPHEVKHWMDPEIIPFGWGLFTDDEEVVVIEGEEGEMPLCVTDLISNRDILNTSSINSIVVNSRTNSTNEMENLLNSSSCLINSPTTGMDNPLNASSHLIKSSNSMNEMENLLKASSSHHLINSTSSNSGSINLPLGPRGSWAPVDETSAI